MARDDARIEFTKTPDRQSVSTTTRKTADTGSVRSPKEERGVLCSSAIMNNERESQQLKHSDLFVSLQTSLWSECSSIMKPNFLFDKFSITCTETERGAAKHPD